MDREYVLLLKWIGNVFCFVNGQVICFFLKWIGNVSYFRVEREYGLLFKWIGNVSYFTSGKGIWFAFLVDRECVLFYKWSAWSGNMFCFWSG